MHHDEKWQVYALNGEPIKGVGWDSALDNPECSGSDVIVGVTVVFLYRLNDDGKLEMLWQKRSEKVDRYPGGYDVSSGGHINLGESAVEGAVRECYEEIGAKVTADDLKLVTVRIYNKTRFAWVFVADWTGKAEDFNFEDGEVSGVKWVPFAETEEFRLKYAKEPLKKEKLTFKNLEEWFSRHGYIQAE